MVDESLEVKYKHIFIITFKNIHAYLMIKVLKLEEKRIKDTIVHLINVVCKGEEETTMLQVGFEYPGEGAATTAGIYEKNMQ